MNRLFVALLLLLAAGVFAQQDVSAPQIAPAPQKFALVIGNGKYTSFGSLPNAVNDASDMADALQGLGFTVDKILDGSREQMAEAITRLKDQLSVSNNSYGFLFYAGHGVQFNGVNYLIPAAADIPSANYLGDTAISVQTILAELDDAGNELNVVVLDACRDFPAAWSRTTNRGLAAITNQPANSIIVYAAGVGSTVPGGTGGNGLFTSLLLKNLKTPGVDASEVFYRTSGDVSGASHGQQNPEVYNQYFGIAYLGQRSAAGVPEVAWVQKGDTDAKTAGGVPAAAESGEIVYLSQRQITSIPELPEAEIVRAMVYPPIARRSNKEGIAYLELFIDSQGNIRQINILREDPPDWGFGRAAVNALKGIKGKPAQVNGKPVAVRYRYPIRFTIK